MCYVIPAHAGIQRKAQHAVTPPPLWMGVPPAEAPAFAGMTGVGAGLTWVLSPE